ncbi:hypothetical protein CDL15_Pgr024843 [Punica granatum]|uniref:Uncharacterized protein n=1 Tax=Punica granatum TaxID=22663 RepID=A0A218XDX5_PUNGR|nr:hypothetical protein CDL15_Pgr024843 [Punica granatum]
MQPKKGKLSAPHFGPPASYTRSSDRGSGHYSSPDNQRRIGRHGVMNNGRRARSLRKVEESHQKNKRTKNPETAELALRHYSSLSHRSTERCPIWDSKNPFSAKVTNDTSRRISGASCLSWDTSIPHGRLF